jgi:aminoglycoside phosphotransferase (APT) family kinase protein
VSSGTYGLPSSPHLEAPNLESLLQAWVAVGDTTITSAKLLVRSDKSTVYRLRLDGIKGKTVIAKRSAGPSIAAERAVYTQIMPALGIRVARFYGSTAEGNDAGSWMFLEDIAGQEPSSSHDWALVGGWVAQMHASSSGLSSTHGLPPRDAGYYQRRLHETRAKLAARLSDARERESEDCRSLQDAVEVCDSIDRRWDFIAEYAESLPRVFVHGDFSALNVRVCREGEQNLVVPLDWEKAGWGPAAVDLFAVDLHAYWEKARSFWPAMGLGDAEAMQRCGEVFRVLSHDWARKPPEKVRTYARRLQLSAHALNEKTERPAARSVSRRAIQ